MTSLFLSLGAFVVWALSIIMIYYSDSYSHVTHIESSSGYGTYILSILILYALYKGYTIFIMEKKTLKLGFFTILGIGLTHLAIICGFYSALPEITKSPLLPASSISSITLFFHVIELLIYPVILIFVTRALGYTIISKLIESWKSVDIRIRLGGEISIGFIVFIVLLLSLASLGMYTLAWVIMSLLVMTIVGIPGCIETWKDIRSRTFEIENHKLSGTLTESINLKLLSIEFGFFFFTFLFSISLINAIRPMPIGWDDLGVYMNFPKMIALSGELLHGAGMYSWQLLTSTGFLFGNNASQAFYVNQIGGILAVISIIMSLSYIFEEKNKKSLLSLPVLLGALYYAMPMTIFQQAKDMKLDPAYLFFAVSGFMLIFSLRETLVKNTRDALKIVALAGLIVGLSFTVKVTSVLLIIGLLGLLSYKILSLSGYMGFFFLFLGIFTYGDLWKVMGVPMPRDNMALMHTMSLLLGMIGIVCLGLSLYLRRGEKNGVGLLKSWIISCLTFIVFVGLGLSPWLVKNGHELGAHSVINNPLALLSGSGGNFPVALDTIYTKAEISERENLNPVGITTEGQSDNEDMGRYFGYDTGINNYLKLPANLTFQKNQSGEFTDITYFFLAFFPVALLFVRSRRSLYQIFIGSILAFCISYYFTSFGRETITGFFASWNLGMNSGIKSYGYAILLALNLIFVGLTHFLLEKTETNNKIKEMTAFMGVYAFLFMIAAFGIVWYGIVVYFGFFALIGLALSSLLDYEKDDVHHEEKISIQLTFAVTVFILIAVYFVRSSFPHGWNNLKSAYYNEYKYFTLNQEESIFAYRTDYLLPIATMNLKDPSKALDGVKEKLTSKALKEKLGTASLGEVGIEEWHNFSLQNHNTSDIPLRNDARLIGNTLYNNILYPPKENTNTGGIYRIGTFMTYLINKNRERYLEDSLIFTFNTYFYDKSPETTIERMKKLGLKYLLVDLNAATIDKDPRHALTSRFEKLLLSMRAKNLRLVSTDNFCLELAIGEYKKGKIQTDEEFLSIAATNSESYKADGTPVPRGQKVFQCQNYIIKLINDRRGGEYTVTDAIQKEIAASNAAKDSDKLGQVLLKYTGQSWFTLFEITDLPTPAPSLTGSLSTGSGVQK